jgi:hypothetical protein
MPIDSAVHELVPLFFGQYQDRNSDACKLVFSFKFLHRCCDGDIKCGYCCAPNWITSSLRKADDHLSGARCTIHAFPKGRPRHPCKNWQSADCASSTGEMILLIGAFRGLGL